jgi:uncharacterized membrane protein
MAFFPYLKWIHVLAAITALGANITYAVWLARAARDPAGLPFALRGIKALDDRVANPAYGLLLVTGLLMVFVTGLPLTTPWLLTALVLYAGLFAVGAAAYTPALRRQIQAVETPGPQSDEYRAISARAQRLGVAVTLVAVAIVFLMVVKPSLWG